MAKDRKRLRVLLDTNILISAFQFGGPPLYILEYVRSKRIIGIASEELLVELLGVLRRKFQLSEANVVLADKKIRKSFHLVSPTVSITAVRDVADNRVLEAAITGQCDYIITGDQDLLRLKKYKDVTIITVKQFLEDNASML